MIIDCISDLHGHYPKLKGGDLLIVAGDLTATSTSYEYDVFVEWVLEQNYKTRIVIGGNHDTNLCKPGCLLGLCDYPPELEYLCDSGTEFEYLEPAPIKGAMMATHRKLKIWGSPWTLRFEGMNPHCMAFTVDTEEELAEKWKLIPDDIDILVTHSPPMKIFDWNKYGDNCGSLSLLTKATSLPNLKLFIFGHIHEAYGIYEPNEIRKFAENNRKISGPPKCKSMPYLVNASHVNERYEPVNKPIRIEL